MERRCCVQGYHVYKDVWEAAVGEVLIREQEPDSASDRYAVEVKRRNYCWTFASRTNECVHCSFDGAVLYITCTLTGHRKYSDLLRGALQIPS